MKKTRKIFSLILLLGLALVLLTGCAAQGFDGSWNCIEAEIPTYGMLSASDAALIERSGVVSTMCEIEIKGTDIKYSESGTSYAVSDVRRDDTVITFKAKHNISGTDTAPTDLFTAYVKSELGADMVREYRFHDTRKWRFDYAIPALKIAVECDGGVWGYGRHNRPKGYIKDMEKFNAAAEMGWVVLKFTPQQLTTHNAIETLRITIAQRVETLAKQTQHVQ